MFKIFVLSPYSKCEQQPGLHIEKLVILSNDPLINLLNMAGESVAWAGAVEASEKAEV